MQFFLVFQFVYSKSIFFESFRRNIILKIFEGFLFRTSKLKNEINYIKYKFSHRFENFCRWLNMYYSNIRIITFLKIKTISIWIILKNLIRTYRECNFYQYWDIQSCIHPLHNEKLLCYTFGNKNSIFIFGYFVVASHFLCPKKRTKGLRYLWRLLGLERTCYDLGYDNYKITLLWKCCIFGFVILIKNIYIYIFPSLCR